MKNDLLLMLFESGLSPDHLKQVEEAFEIVQCKYTSESKVKNDTKLSNEDLLAIYLMSKTVEGYSSETLDNHRTMLHKLFQYTNKSIYNINIADLRLFLIKYKQDRNIADITLDKYRQYIRTFFQWLQDEGYLNSNPAVNLKAIHFEKKEREALSQLELECLRFNCATTKERLILEMLYSTGCRVSELINIKLSDINFDEKSIHIFGKGKKHRTSYMNAKVLIILKEYLSIRQGTSEYLIVSDRYPYEPLHRCGIEKILRNIKQRAIENSASISKRVSPHVIRHTMATTARKNGMSLENIQALLGHERIETTMVYVKVPKEHVKHEHEKYIV